MRGTTVVLSSIIVCTCSSQSHVPSLKGGGYREYAYMHLAGGVL